MTVMNHLALLAALVCAARECLAQDPVSALDGKAGIAAGEDNWYYAEASFAFPLGRRYGGQLDGLIGDQDGTVKALAPNCLGGIPRVGFSAPTHRILKSVRSTCNELALQRTS